MGFKKVVKRKFMGLLNKEQKKLFKHILYLSKTPLDLASSEKEVVLFHLKQQLVLTLDVKQEALFGLLDFGKEKREEKSAISFLENLTEDDFQNMTSFSSFSDNLLTVLDSNKEVHIEYCKQDGKCRIFITSFSHLRHEDRPLLLSNQEHIYLSDNEDENRLKKLFIRSMRSISVREVN